jgi:hypothetical protein
MAMQEIRSILKRFIKEVKDIWFNQGPNVANSKNNESHVMGQEEKLDETIDESFPASDPPGHFSKSSVDKELH